MNLRSISFPALCHLLYPFYPLLLLCLDLQPTVQANGSQCCGFPPPILHLALNLWSSRIGHMIGMSAGPMEPVQQNYRTEVCTEVCRRAILVTDIPQVTLTNIGHSSACVLDQHQLTQDKYVVQRYCSCIEGLPQALQELSGECQWSMCHFELESATVRDAHVSLLFFEKKNECCWL